MNISKFPIYGILVIFLSTLILATVFAYTRGYSGATGLDMAKVQKMRTDSAKQIAESQKITKALSP